MQALKNFLKVTSHYKDFVADQYDFHSYCLRKQTLRAYVDLLRFEDNIYAHPSYAEVRTVAGRLRARMRWRLGREHAVNDAIFSRATHSPRHPFPFPTIPQGACGAVETYLALDTARRLQREQAASAAAASNGATTADAKK